MTNKLIRVGQYQMFPATPYVPYQPAYSYLQPIWGNPVAPGWAVSGGTVVPTGKIPSTGKIVNYGSSGGGGSISVSAPPPGTEIIGWEIVEVPEVPEQEATGGGYLAVPPTGWTSFARSFAHIRAGYASFKVPEGVAGVVAGLAEFILPTAGYAHIKHGLRFISGHVYNARTGADYGTYAAADVFKVLNTGVSVVLMKNGSELATESSTYRSEPLYLMAALFDVDDAVDEPELVEEAYGTSAISLPMLLVEASQNSYGSSHASTPNLTVSAGTGDAANTVLPSMATLATDVDNYGAAIITLPALTVQTYGGMVPGIGSANSVTSLPSLRVSSIMLTGETGGSTTSLPMLGRMISEANYAEAIVELPMLTGYAWTDNTLEAYAVETVNAASPGEATGLTLVTVLDGVAVGSTVLTTALIDAVIQEQLTASGTAATEQLLDAIARSFIQAGSTGILESAVGRTDLDTPVWHDQAGGSTMYRGYSFNSFARIGGKYYGANEDGLFLLEGDDDAGTLIHASIDLGRLDFKTAEKKTISQCYLGMAADGNLVLKVIAEGKEYLYKTRSFSPEMQQQRITTGKGLKTNYITAQFFNENGADFEIDSVRFFVADLTRRIN